MALALGLGMGLSRRRGNPVTETETETETAYQQILTLAAADGWTAVYDPTNPDTRTLREDSGSFYFEEIQDGLGNLPAIAAAVAGNQPQLSVGFFSQLDACLSPDDQRLMWSADFDSAVAPPYYVIAVMRKRILTTSIRYSVSLGSVVGSPRHGVLDSVAGSEYFTADSSFFESITAATTEKTVVATLWNGVDSEIIINGAIDNTGTVGTANTAATRVMYMARGNFSGRWQGEVGPLLFYSGNPSSAVRERMYDLIHDLSGIARA